MSELDTLCPLIAQVEDRAKLQAVLDRILDLPRGQRAEFFRRANALGMKRKGEPIFPDDLVRDVVGFEE